MKAITIHILYIILIFFFNCNAQKTSSMEEKIMIPKLTKNKEIIDIDLFKEKMRYEKQTNNEHKVFSRGNIGFGEVTYFNNSFFKRVKSFYPNKNSRKKGVSFNNGSKYGIWYEFNEEGKLIKEINTDEGYTFGWDKIIEYCEKNNIILEKGYPKQGGIKTEIYKNEEDGNKVWTITYYNYKKEQYLGLTIDGKIGKLLNEQVIEFEGN